MDTLLPFALLCFTSFFTLTNPLGTMPVFLTMTHGMTDKERRCRGAACHDCFFSYLDGLCLCRATPYLSSSEYLYQWVPYGWWGYYF